VTFWLTLSLASRCSKENGREKLKHVLTLTLALAFLAFSGAPASADPGGQSDLAQVRRATAKYHNVDRAIAAGYSPASPCIDGMGYHYLNRGLDGTTASAPNVLLYAPKGNGKLKLVGVEYVVFSEDPLMVAPTLFGQTFYGPMTHGPVPQHFELHVWIWLGNPDGAFEQENDKVTCP